MAGATTSFYTTQSMGWTTFRTSLSVQGYTGIKLQLVHRQTVGTTGNFFRDRNGPKRFVFTAHNFRSDPNELHLAIVQELCDMGVPSNVAPGISRIIAYHFKSPSYGVPEFRAERGELPVMLFRVVENSSSQMVPSAWMSRGFSAEAAVLLMEDVEIKGSDSESDSDSNSDSDSESGDCVICLEELVLGGGGKVVKRTLCNHCFHVHCILKWLRSSNVCPLCRFKIR